MMKEIILIGGGGHCKSVIDVIETGGIYKIAGIIDMAENIGQNVLGVPVIGCDDDLEKLRKTYSLAHITLGQIHSPDTRIKLFTRLTELGFELPVIISPTANVSKHAQIGAGTVIMHQCAVNAASVTGKNCIINTKALIEHDAVIGDHCHVSTCAVVNGAAVVGRGSFIGSNATVVNCANVPENSFVKAGSLFK